MPFGVQVLGVSQVPPSDKKTFVKYFATVNAYYNGVSIGAHSLFLPVLSIAYRRSTAAASTEPLCDKPEWPDQVCVHAMFCFECGSL